METRRTKLIAVAVVTLIGAMMRLYGLGSQPLSGDDAGVAVSAWHYVDTGNLGPTMWNHPPLRNLLVYASLWLFGGGVWGLKIASLATGILSIPLLFFLALRIFKTQTIAALAAFFLAVDPLHIDFSRQAVHEVYMMFFSLSGILLALEYQDGGKPVRAIFSGVCFGLGLASKWYVAFPLLATVAFLIYGVFKRPPANAEKTASLFFVISALIMLPFLTYLLTFLPWFQRGYGIAEWFSLQRAMYGETKIHSGYNPYGFELDHNAALWFVKPVAFADFIFAEGRPKVLLGIAHPLVWLLTIPSILYLLSHAVRQKIREYWFLFSLFWFSYLPFLAAQRPIWAHTAFSVLPFGFMAISFALVDCTSGMRRRTLLLSGYVLAVLLLAVPLYLLAVGRGLDMEWLRPIVLWYRPSYERY